MAVSDDVAQAQGARDVTAMVTHHTRTDGAANRRDLALAQALDRRWTRAADALSAGDVNVAQARVIAHALDELPADKVSAEVLGPGREHLVAQAAHFGPRELRLLGRRVLDVVAPEVAEQHEAEQLAAEEQRAWRRTSWSARGSATAPPASSSRWRTEWRLGCTPTSRRSPLHVTAG